MLMANECVAIDLPMPAGYRIAIHPLPIDSGLKAGEKQELSTLAQLGFQASSKEQTDRESRGQNIGILCHVGGAAFKGSMDCGQSVPREGDVVVFNKYAGAYQEYPPGSGDTYHFCNDEDILGVYDCNVLGGDQ
jgi:co-chaperonin GroES (HSP10)